MNLFKIKNTENGAMLAMHWLTHSHTHSLIHQLFIEYVLRARPT